MMVTQTQAVRTVVASLAVIALVLGLAVAGVSTSHGNNAANGTVTDTVEPGGTIVISGNFSDPGNATVELTADSEINLSDNTTISSLTELYPDRDRNLTVTSDDFGNNSDYATDVVEIDVNGTNITQSVDGTIEDDEINVSVDVVEGANTTSLVSAPVSYENPGIFGSGGLLGGTDRNTLLIGAALLAVLYLWSGRDD